MTQPTNAQGSRIGGNLAVERDRLSEVDVVGAGDDDLGSVLHIEDQLLLVHVAKTVVAGTVIAASILQGHLEVLIDDGQ